MRTAIAILLTLCGPALALAADPLIGQKVFLKDNAVVMFGEQVADDEFPFDSITVVDVRGDRVILLQIPFPIWTERKYVLSPSEAVAYFNEQVEQNPNSAAVWSKRGSVWVAQKQLDKAIADFGAALRIDPNFNAARLARGITRCDTQDYAGAIEDFSEMIRVAPKEVGGFNGAAWVWATAADEKYRDGERAVKYATTACEMSAWTVGSVLDTLAAAYAEKGDFDSAVKWQEKAVGLIAGQESEAACRDHLELFKAGKPYHDDPRAKASTDKPAAE